jgi:type I restriction enzyme S subunit
MIEVRNTLQKNWEWVKLADLSDKISLNKIKIKQKDYLQKGEFPVVDQGQDLIGGYHNNKNLIIPGQPPYIIFGDHTKVKKYINFNFIAGADGVKVLKPKDIVEPKFLFYSLFAIKIEDKGYARHFQLLEKEFFPLPPRATQQAIVCKIEELFSELDKGIENLRTAQQQLSVYRKAILMDGVTGRLTAKWRTENPKADSSEKVFIEIQKQLDKSLKASTELAILNGKRKPKDQRKNKKTTNVESDLPELPGSWEYFRLEDITYLVTDGTHFTPKYQDSGVKFLSVKNVRPFYFREESLKYISEQEHKMLIGRCNPQKGDILYTKVGATFGYAAKVTMDYEFSIFVSLCLIKPVYECFSSNFLEMLMNSELIFQQARKRVSGSGVPDLHLIEIRDFKIPLPSIAEQNEIVQEIESRLSIADEMEGSISQSLEQAETLRQSILKKAFEGSLV